MKTTLLIVAIGICCATSLSHAALPPELSSTNAPLPPKGSGDVPNPSVLIGGDTFATATVIGALPFADAGNTCAFNHDYIQGCLPASTAADVFYRFTPAANVCVNVSLCGSAYDTGISVFNGTTATEIACNDDNCGLQSSVSGVALLAGNTYYFIVDGFSLACGDYSLSITECPPPPVCDPCPPGSVAEGEPVCFTGYVDSFNGGCNSTPNVFSILPCNPNLTVCGTYGTYNANGSRDTDWYQFTVTAATVINVSVNGFGLTGSALAIVDNVCPPNVICGSFAPSAQCATNTCSAPLGPGTYRIFTASFFDNTPCGSTYVMTISGMSCPTEVPVSTWGKLKTLYR